MTAERPLTSLDDADMARRVDTERTEHLEACHWLGDLHDGDTITVSIPIDGFNTCDVEIEKGPATADLFALLAAYAADKAEKTEAIVRDLGFQPSDWSPPDDDDAGEEGDAEEGSEA